MQSIIDTSLEVVRRSHVTANYNPSISVTGSRILSGSLFTHLVDALFQILENAVIYGDRVNPIDSMTGSVEGDVTEIVISNRVPPEKADRQALEGLTLELKERLREKAGPAVQRESGTGFYKLAKLLHVDLSHASPEIRIEVENRGLDVVLFNVCLRLRSVE